MLEIIQGKTGLDYTNRDIVGSIKIERCNLMEKRWGTSCKIPDGRKEDVEKYLKV